MVGMRLVGRRSFGCSVTALCCAFRCYFKHPGLLCSGHSPTPNTPLTFPQAPVASSHAPLTPEELDKVVRLVENDPRILMEVMANLAPENRRRLIVTGGAMEWFGKESAAQELEEADIDKDRRISPKDFDHWFESALKRNQEEKKRINTAVSAATGFPNASAAAVSIGANHITTSAEGEKNIAIPFSAFLLIAIEAGLPFVGFGFLDNVGMILAGDLIDSTLGFYLNCSVMASAAMGNVCSGIVSMQVHGFIEQFVQRLNFNTPVLTEEQMKSRRVFFAGHIGGTIGIMVGLSLGMLPLLFLDVDTNEKSDYVMFRRWDKNNSGFIDLREVENVLRELGLVETEEKARKLIETYGDGNRVNFEQFSRFKADLRSGRSIFV